METVFSIKGEFSMDNKKYLKWYNKIGYGSGDIAGNIVYAFLATFVMIYLTDTAGLNAGIVGTLMLIAIFAVPLEWGDVAKYAYFFITLHCKKMQGYVQT